MQRAAARMKPQRAMTSRRDPLDFLLAAARGAVDGAAAAGNSSLRRDLNQRLEHESALMHARMWNNQRWLADGLVAEKQQIKVERARGIRETALAGVPALQCLQFAQQLWRAERRVERGHGVDEIGLRAVADGSRAVKRRACDEARGGQ